MPIFQQQMRAFPHICFSLFDVRVSRLWFIQKRKVITHSHYVYRG